MSESQQSESFTQEQMIQKLVSKLKEGASFPLYASEDAYEAKPVAKHYSYREFTEFEEMALERLKAEQLAKLNNRRVKLDENDKSLKVPTEQLDAIERHLTMMVPIEALEAYNVDLKAARSAPITHRDIAFIASVHRDSVLNNGQHREEFVATSPFKRIVVASTELRYREKPFDNRQIRYALGILEELSFTKELEPAKRSSQAKRAARWEICRQNPWESFFQKRA